MSSAGWLTDLADLLLPAGCIACGDWVPRGAGLLCGRCLSRLRSPPWPRCSRCGHPRGTGRTSAERCLHCDVWPDALAGASAAVVLEPPATDCVHALKYEGWRELAGPMALRMARALPPDWRFETIVPVPTTAPRRRDRGYNQAHVLACALGRRLGVPVTEALRRSEARRSQTALRPDQRRENVRGAFAPAVAERRSVAGRPVLLVDDVLTTGATASEAARALVDMGASRVCLLTFARALPARRRQAA